MALGSHPDPRGGWPDAIAVSGLAARQGRPILLVEHGELPAATRAALGETSETVVVGGPAAVDDRGLDDLADPDGDGHAQVTVSRVAGRDRYETSTLVADRAVAAGADPSDLWLVTGRDYAASHADHVVGMVSVDMIAVGGPTCVCWWRDGTSAGAARLDAVRAQVGLTGFDVQATGDISDHGPFARRGVPAALLSTPSDSRYHTPDDTSQYLERETVRRSGDLTLAFVRSLTTDDRGGPRRVP